MRARRRPLQTVMGWLKRQPPKVKALLAVIAAMAALVALRAVIRNHDNLFVAAEAVHTIGIAVLIYKLTKEKTCAGLSLKSQELTGIFLAARLYCSFIMEYDIHTLLDSATLIFTLWVIYMMRFKLRSTYMEDKDNFAHCYVLIPCAILALIVHPTTSHHFLNRILWAFCVYLEAVSVLPQLRVMQNTKIVEPFTAHYVFALGVARFLSCAHWVLQYRWRATRPAPSCRSCVNSLVIRGSTSQVKKGWFCSSYVQLYVRGQRWGHSHTRSQIQWGLCRIRATRNLLEEYFILYFNYLERSLHYFLYV